VKAGKQAAIIVYFVEKPASNGVLHQIDSVLLPSWYFLNPKQALDALPSTFSRLSALIQAAQVTQEVSMLTNSTLCAPNNIALSNTLPATLAYLMDPNNKPILEEVILYHAIVGVIPFTQLSVGTHTYATLQGEPVPVTVTQTSTGSGKILRFNDARSVGTGFYLTKDDLIYELDRLLIPPSLLEFIPTLAATIAPPADVSGQTEVVY
jgi:uncharacterized surface protein with fasciclin (FAS1) repeats